MTQLGYGYWMELVHSPDDGGYYTSVIDSLGKTVHHTKLRAMAMHAERDAQRWVDEQHQLKESGTTPYCARTSAGGDEGS